jgi:hypothetical protein
MTLALAGAVVLSGCGGDKSSGLRSARGLNGRPAYPATATATWKLTFGNYGDPIPAPAGAPSQLHSDVTGSAVVVDEVQTIVTSTGWARSGGL